MLFTNWNNKLLTFAMVLLGLITLAPSEGSAFPSSLIRTINAWQWSPPSPDSAGIVYLPASDRLLVCDSEVNEMPIFTGDNLFEATLTGNLMNTLTTVSFSDEPTGVTLNPSNGHLFFSDDTGTKSIYEMNPGPDGQYDTADDIITSFKTGDFGSYDPEGVTFASGLGALFIADGVNEEVYQVNPGANGIFDGVPPAGDDQVTSFDLTSLGVLDPEGIAFNSDNGNLYVVGKPSDTLFEVTIDGALVQMIDISAANARKPAGLAYAPSSLNPNIMNIYIAARGVDNDSDPNENDGQVYEMTLPASTNHPPVANDDSANTSEDTPVIIDVAANDTDPNGNLDPASANTSCGTCSDPVSGSLVNHGDGTFTYTPDSGFTGPDSFVYEICDTEPLCDTATADIMVTISNAPPVAVGDNANTSEDTPVTIDVAANDSDPDGNLDPASANTSCGTCANPANGSLLNHGDGTFSYTPDPDFNGTDNFIYEICDTLDACDIGTVNISINPVNDPPVANDDSANTPEDTTVTIDVAANDSDADGNLDPASANTSCATCSDPVDGNLFNHGDGTFDYTPDPGFTGVDSFVYEICDTEPLCDTAMATITVNPAAPMTIEVRVAASTDDAEEKSSGGMRLTSSDLEFVYDKGEQTVGMRFNGVEVPQGATITSAYLQFQVDEVNTENTNLSLQGQASDAPVTFTASSGNVSNRPRTVAAVSWAPEPWTTKGEAGPGQQTPDISAIIQEIVDRPGWTSGNSLVIIITGTGERTAESFDGTPSAAPLLHVGFSSGGQSNNPPLANDDSASTTVETPVTIDVAANDTDPDGNLDPTSANTSCGTCADPANGSLLNHGDGSFSYTPDPGFTGSDSFVYEICDTEPLCDTATADITVTLSNNPPVAVDDSASTTVDTPVTIDVTANDTDPNGNLDPASANTSCGTCADPANGSLLNHGDGTFTYIPDPGFTGPDSFVYEICDTEPLCDTATADIMVTISNDPPVAVGDDANTSEDTPVTIDVAANDSDPDGNLDPASANTTCGTCANPANGSLLNHGDGTITYTPNPNFSGSDSFIYEICDTLGACDIGTVNISINPVNDPPVANDDSANTPEDTTVTIDVAANDSDSDDNLDPASANTSCGTCSDPISGILFNYGDGTFDYTPDVGFTGDDSFVYEICDTEPLCDTALATITVYPAAPMTIEVRVAASTDDAEEKVSGGMRLMSSDLELVYDKGDQTVGMRFNAVEVPQGATITSAYLQFQVDEVNTVDTNLSIQGQASDAPVTFTASTGNVSNRPRTVAAVSWAPEPWTTKSEAGPGQQTPDISAIIQEIVDRPGWTSGNSLVIIITGTGERTAESFDGTPSAAPLLHVGFSSGN